jgi:hypothetical protein
MTEYAKLSLAVDSREVDKADKSLKKLEKQGGRTERATDQLGQAFRRIAGPLAAFLSTRQILKSAEAWTTINNRLKLVTDSTEELIAAQEDVFRIAQESRQPLESTAELYQRIAFNADELGVSGAGVAAIVDTISKTMAISGTSTAGANAAMVQLGQAFASGTLRGEELNSVLEQAPALAAQNVIDALLNQGAAVDELFTQIQPTISQSFSVLSNSLTRTVGQLDDATGASSDLAEQLITISRWLDSGAFVDGILTSMSIWRSTIDATTDNIIDLHSEVGLLGDIGVRAAGEVGDAFLLLPANIKAAFSVLVVEGTSFFSKVVIQARLAKEKMAAIFTDDTIAAATERFEKSNEAINSARADGISLIFAERDAILLAAEADKQRRKDESEARDKARAEREAEIARLRGSASGVDLTSGDSKAFAMRQNQVLYLH